MHTIESQRLLISFHILISKHSLSKQASIITLMKHHLPICIAMHRRSIAV